jgi:hypothetical protein
MESILGQWADSISSAVGISIDGKTLHGSAKHSLNRFVKLNSPVPDILKLTFSNGIYILSKRIA